MGINICIVIFDNDCALSCVLLYIGEKYVVVLCKYHCFQLVIIINISSMIYFVIIYGIFHVISSFLPRYFVRHVSFKRIYVFGVILVLTRYHAIVPTLVPNYTYQYVIPCPSTALNTFNEITLISLKGPK